MSGDDSGTEPSSTSRASDQSDQPGRSDPSAAVAVITYCRPDFVRTCLEHLAAQTRPADETLVIDASPDTRTREVVRDFPSVRYLHSDAGPGTMATSRAMALAATACDVLVFLDDDAYADADWLEHLLAAVCRSGRGRSRRTGPQRSARGGDRGPGPDRAAAPGWPTDRAFRRRPWA
ncbi:MAG: glycosyltransferase [Dermatophilaceae bacterium]